MLDERKIKHYLVAEDLRISKAQLNRILCDQIELRVGQLEYFADLFEMPIWAFFPDRKTSTIDLFQAVQKFVADVSPLVTYDSGGEHAEDRRTVPLLRVAATPDNETYDDESEPRRYEIPLQFYRPRVAAFEVIGDSMSGEGIMSGDVVFTRPPRTDDAGEIVVCSVDGFRHLKRLLYRSGKIELVSLAPKRSVWRFDPDAHDFQVLGVVTGRVGPIAR